MSLADTLIAAIRTPLTPQARLDLARRLLAEQAQSIPALGALIRGRGVDLAAVTDWRDLPAVPTAAFKHMPLFTGDPAAAVRTFQTSGTSGSGPGRAYFSADGMAVMAQSIRVNAAAHLLAGGRATKILVLAPPPQAAPHMIMAAGMAQLVEEFSLPGGRFLIGPGGLDVPGLLAELAADGPPLTLIGASFGFVHLLDNLAAKGLSYSLPAGSRIMDAGGFKGRSRTVTYPELLSAFEDRFGVPQSHCVNLLGMTELASQFYDSVMADDGPRRKVNPPWTATSAHDPATLAPLPDGETGLLRHLDLANLDRPCVIQTDDLGRTVPGGFEVFGRATADGSRGCSISVDEILGAV